MSDGCIEDAYDSVYAVGCCSECWDPTDDPSDTLCWWHKMSEEQQAREVKRSTYGLWAAVVGAAAIMVAVLLLH